MSPTKRSGLRRDVTSAAPARTPSKPKKRRKGKPKEPVLSLQEKFDAQKDALIQEKRAKGNEIVHRHEDMLHEMFYLQDRITLLDYDPKVVRNNQSEKFLEYKSAHDLMILSSVDESLSRRTRRAHNELTEFIKGPSTSSLPRHKSAVFLDPQPTSTMSTKKRGKQKATAPEWESTDLPTASPASAPAPRKRRKTTTNSVPNVPTDTVSSVQPTLDPPESIPTQGPHRIVRSSRRRAGPSTIVLPAMPDLPSRSRKVFLRVTQSEGTLDRLLQSSSEPLPSSFVGLDGKSGLLLSKLEAHRKMAATLAEKRAEFRRKDWYLPLDRNGERRREPPEEPERLNATWDVILKAVEVTYRPDPLYLATTRRICEAIKTRAGQGLYGQSTQGRLARGTIKGKGSKKQRDDPETVWRKRLAKATAELVVDQWKRVVLYVREKRRAEEEEEERRRGQEHLDAILDQSRHILESQHVNLSRAAGKPVTEASSRSQSRLTQGDSGDDSDQEAEEEAQDVEAEISSDEEAEGHEEGTMALLGGSGPSSPPEADFDQEQATVRSRHTSPDDANQFPTTPPSPDAMNVETSLQLNDPMGDGISMDSQHLDSIKELVVVSKPSPASLPPESSEPDYREPDLVSTRPSTPSLEDEVGGGTTTQDDGIEHYLRPYAVTKVDGWDPDQIVKPSPLLRGSLRPYQRAGLEWLANHHTQLFNCILSDEMGLGKTIQAIALLAHLASDRGIWGPHLIIVPTSVILNWEMEFKKFLPGFKVLSYYGNPKRRRELRKGWNDKYHFNVCITSYALALKDAAILRRKQWYYMILDEAHMIKNFKSQRWMTLAVIKSFRRLLLTGTPLQNNLTELFALLQFIMSGMDFAGFKEFEGLLSAPLEKAVELGEHENEENQQRVSKLHQLLRPFLLRRLKRDVEKDLPNKYEHLELCPLSKRQRFLYDEFMARADTRKDLRSGNYHRVANILMQLRKVCNHPDLFEVRPIVTSFAMGRSAIADYEIKELLVRRRLLSTSDDDGEVNLDLLGLVFTHRQGTSELAAYQRRSLAEPLDFSSRCEAPGPPPLRDTRTFEGYKRWRQYQLRHATWMRWNQTGYVNGLKCSHVPVYGRELLSTAARMYKPILPLSEINLGDSYWDTNVALHSAVMSRTERAREVAPIVEKFAFATPVSVAMDMPTHALRGYEDQLRGTVPGTDFDAPLHHASVKLRIAFPDPSLLQYDCGKLQRLAHLLRERKAGGHRALIFTQMTKILDILELFLNFHGHIYLRLDGATKIEDRQYITERFNSDSRVFCFISSSRSGGVGINLTGADTVIFYDSDFNPQMDKQCEDRAHRIGQIRDVHIYRFISEHTVEEALLRKANQKRSLNEIVIQKGEFDWRSLFNSEQAMARALEGVEDVDDARAAQVATREAREIEGLDDLDFGYEAREEPEPEGGQEEGDEEEEEDGETTQDYMLRFVESDGDFFSEWRI